MKKNILFSKHLRSALQTVAIIALLLLHSSIQAQSVFWTENFENVAVPSSGTRNPMAKSSVGSSSQFHRTDGNTINPKNTNSFGSKKGNFYWSGEYNNFSDNQDEQIIVWNDINIAGKTGLSFQGLFAAINEKSQLNKVKSAENYIVVEYAIDNETYKPLLYFKPNKDNLLEEDNETKMDYSQPLSNKFSNFSKSILGSGNTLKPLVLVKLFLQILQKKSISKVRTKTRYPHAPSTNRLSTQR